MKSLVQAFKPQTVAVLGDVFSRQDISNEEFQTRVYRYSNIIQPVTAQVFVERRLLFIVMSDGCAVDNYYRKSRCWLLRAEELSSML